MAKELIKKRLMFVSLMVIIIHIEINAKNNLLQAAPPNLDGIEKTELLYKAGDGKVNVTQTIAVTDEDDTNLETAKVQITEGYKNNEDELSFVTENGITGQWNKASGTLTLSGQASVENYQSALRNIRFENPKSKPTPGSRTVAFIVNDGTDDSNLVSRKISILAENIAPVLAGIETSEIEYSGKTNITANITVSDEDNTNLQSAEIKVSTEYHNGEDRLLFSDAEGITGSWSAATGTLTLTGDASLAAYQTALRNVQFENTSATPIAGTRTITFTVNDGTVNSNQVSRKIKVNPVNQPPVLAALESSTLTYTEGDGRKAITTAITVTDPDNTNLQSAKIVISNGYESSEDQLIFTNINGITGDWNSGNGTLTLSGNATLAQYQEALRSIQFENKNTTNPTPGPRTISFMVNDGSANSNTSTRDINVVEVNQPPVLASIESTALNYNEGAGKVAITGTITANDGDTPNLQSAQITISAGYKNGEDALSFTNANGISGAWDAANGTLTLTGDATLANYQAALRSIQFENTNITSPTAGARTISIVVNDGETNSNTATRNINVAATNQAPVLAAIETTAINYSEGAGKVAITNAITITDGDNANLKSAVITISGGYKNGEDILSFTNANGISGAWDAANGKLTLTGDATLANYQAALRSIQFENTNTANPTAGARTISIVVNDGETNSNTATRNINVAATNQAPVLAAIETTAINYSEGAGKVAITSAITITDGDNANLKSAVITISAGYKNGEDVLSFTNANGISGVWDAANGTLTLTGEATLANYLAALRSIQFENTNTANPTAGARTISIVVNDGETNSNTATRNINVAATNQAPVLAAIESAAIDYSEGAGKVAITSAITVTDGDNANLKSAVITISDGYKNGEDVLSFTNANGISGAWDAANGKLTLTGDATLSNYQAALRSIQFENTNTANPTAGARTISIVVNDGETNSNTATRNINVAATNQAPALAAIESTAIDYSEGAGKVAITSAITITDGDNANLKSAVITISGGYKNGEDVLSFTNANGISGAWDAANGTLTLTGDATLANYQAALRNIQFENTNTANPTAGARTISIVVNDGETNSNTATRNINVAATNQAPVLAAIETTAINYSEGAGEVAITSAISITDGDNANLKSAVITISGGYKNGEDVLSFTNANGISGAWDAANGTLTLTGDATLANYQAALRSIQFENTNITNPTAGARTISIVVNDGETNSNTATRNINVAATNQAPVLAAIETTAINYSEGAGKVAITSAISITDGDNANLKSAVITISAGYKNGEDVLSFTNANGISGAWDAANGTLTLTGDATLANYQAALRSIQFENTNTANPTAGARTISIVVNDGETNSNTATRNINVAATNQAPVLAAIETTAIDYSEGAGKVAITSAITITDGDNANLKSAVITISAGYKNGEDVLSFTNANGISGVWDAANGTLTLTGEATLANYLAALRSIQFENTSSIPTSGSRTISFEVNDGEAKSNTQSRSITISYTNKPPVLSNIESSNLLVVFDHEPTIISTSLTITDLDNSTLSAASVKVTEGYKADEDLLLFTSADNITSSWDQATGTLTLTGVSNISNYQKALRNVKYSNLNNSPSTTERIVAFAVNDGKENSNNLQRTLNFNATPLATDISMEGTMAVCKTITGKYSYSDPENDPEGHTAFQWFRASAPDGEKVAIPEANNLTYTLTVEDQDKYIFFEVTPQAKTGSIQGNAFLSSSSIKIPNTLPTATFSGPSTFCEGTSADLTITFTGTPPFKLVYTDGTNNFDLNSSQLSNKLPVSKTGSYKGISLLDNLGCEVQNLPSTATISTKPAPIAKITNLNSAYSLRGVPVTLQGSPTGGTFSGKGVVENTTFYPSLAGMDGSPHPIVYTYLDKVSGCFDADTVKVAIIDADASIAGLRKEKQYCNIDIPTIITGVNAGGSIGTFSISGDKGLTDNKNNTATLNTNNLLPGSYTISYSYTQNGTQQLIYETITVNLIDNLIIGGLTSPSYCNSAGIIPLNANYNGKFEGAGIDTLKGGAYIYNPRKVIPGDTEVRFTFTNEKGCVITDTIPLKIMAATRPTFEVNSTCWTNADIAFKNTTLRADSVKSWSWQFGEPSSATNQSALKDPSHRYAAAGSYPVRLVATNLNNCNDTITSTLKLGHKPVADFEWDRPCAGKTEALHINNITTSEDSIVSYSWTVTDSEGKIRTFSSAEITSNFRWDEKHTIQLNIKTLVGCKDSIAKILYLNSPLLIKDSTYRESFDNPTMTWNSEIVTNNNWKWQLPAGSITTAHSGTMAVSSQFSETKNDRPLIITSPCFDFTGVDRPFIQLWLNSTGTANEEGVTLQYRTDNSESWTTAGNPGSGINWYNSDNISAFPSGSKVGWTGNTNGWIKANHALDEVANKKNVRLRMLYKPLPGSGAANMFAFDDVLVGNRIKTSLFENFTNLGASNAISSIQMLNEVLNQSSKDVVSLEYHTSFPGTDTLNAANTADPGARVLNYGVGVVPFGLLNGGTTSNLSFDFNSRKPANSDIINQSLNYTPFTMSITTEKATDNIQGKVIITAQDNYSSQQLGLFTAVVEDVVIQSGANKITLYNVVKKFIPSAGGSALKADWTKGEQLEVPFGWNFVKVYNPEKVKVVAFIQSGATKEVLQAAANEVTFVTSSPVIEINPEVKQAIIAPNPASDHARIIFPAPLESETKMEIMTLNGKVLSSEIIQKNVDIYEFETSKMVNGLFLVKLSQKNGNIKIMKLTISR